MSFKANIAFVLQLHTFKNIALPHKARYALRATIYQGRAQKLFAMPFNIVERGSRPKKNVSSQCLIQDNCLISKRFNIEYQEQEIELNDCCQFRLTLDSFPQFSDDQLYLQISLVENASSYFREEINAKLDFQLADTYRFKLENIATGIFRYSEGQFAKGFVSSFSFTLFAMVTDYRFHAYVSGKKSDSGKQKARERVENIEQLVKWADKYLKNCEDRYRFFYQNYIKNLKYNSCCLQAEVNSFLRESKGEIQPRVAMENGQLMPVNHKEFFDYVTGYFPQTITEELIKLQIYKIYEENFYFLQSITHWMSKEGFDMKLLRDTYENERKDLFGERVFRSLVFGKTARDKQSNTKVAKKMRKKRKISEVKLIDQHLFIDKQNQHYAFLQINLPQSLKAKEHSVPIEQVVGQLSESRNSQCSQFQDYDQRNMLVVLVHGFQASTFDMLVIHRELLRALPTAMFLNASCNENDTTGDIEVMGRKLADQIKSYLNRFFKEQKKAILSFVGHSMGGIIARAALRHLNNFAKQLGFYFSLSSPHLGYLNGVDLKIRAGLWFMRKTNKVLSLDQLTMQEKQSLKQTFLYTLSTQGHLRGFKKVILLSSSQDSYVPWHSARVEYYDGSGSRSKVEKEMVQNILGEQIVHRVDIHFDIQSTKDLNSFIGRAAHINLLTQESILKLVNQAIPTLFDIRQI